MSKKKNKIKDCHKPTEIYKNLWVCSFNQAYKIANEMDVLVPLAFLDGDIWDVGFVGEILYYPIMDFGTLPEKILKRLISQVIEKLNDNKKVAIFCAGGHGRTGYVASCILHDLGIKDPIGFLRTNYCEKAVENNRQIKAISRYSQDQTLYDKYKFEIDLEEYYFLNKYYNMSAFLEY